VISGDLLNQHRTVMVDHHGGLRYPRLVRIDGVPDRLPAILAPPVALTRPCRQDA
jgi:hypothetical protein